MRLLFVLFPMLIAVAAGAQQPVHWWWFYKDSLQHYAYAGGDEFSGRSIDRDQWMTSFDGRRNHHGTHSQEYFTDGANISFVDGAAHFATRREPVLARGIEYEPDTARLGDGGPNLREWKYTAGGLVSRDSYRFGLFEARVQLPRGQGAWPSFWLFGGLPNEEFDILEGKGERTREFHVDVHCPGHACDDHRNPIGGLGRWLGINWPGFGFWRRTDGDLTSAYNDYVGEWSPEVLRWYLNGEQAGEWKGKLTVPARLLVMTGLSNTCKGCPFGPGPMDTTTFTDMRVDHVRIWKLLKPDDPTIHLEGMTIAPVDALGQVKLTTTALPERTRPKGGKRGKVRPVFRVKTLLDPSKRTVILEVTGDVRPGSTLDVTSAMGEVLLKPAPLTPGMHTLEFSSTWSGAADIRVSDGTRGAVERISL